MSFSDRVEEHHTFLMASGIAFNILLYLIPLFLVAVYVLSLVFDTNNLATSLENLAGEFLPPTKDVRSVVHKIIVEVRLINEHSAVFGWIGIFVLLWLSSTLISSIRAALNRIFGIPSPHYFFFYRIKDIILTIIFAVLIFLYSYMVPAVSFFVSVMHKYLPEFTQWFFSELVLTSFSMTTSYILFSFIFRSVPNKRLRRPVRMLATVLSVVSIEISRHIFAWYVSGVSSYGKFYGAYAVVAALAVWIYYSALIILLSAELSKYFFDLISPPNPGLREEAVKK